MASWDKVPRDFLTVVRVIAIIGGFAFMQMRAINAAAHDIQAQWLPSVRWVGEMRVQSARYRAVLRDHLIVADAERADVDKNLAARKADFEKAAQAYRPLISSPAERELAAQLDKQWEGFAGAAAEVQSLANKGDVATAKDINARKVVPTGRAMDATLAKLVELNDRGAEVAGQGAEASYWSAILMMAVMLGGVLLHGVLKAGDADLGRPAVRLVLTAEQIRHDHRRDDTEDREHQQHFDQRKTRTDGGATSETAGGLHDGFLADGILAGGCAIKPGPGGSGFRLRH